MLLSIFRIISHYSEHQRVSLGQILTTFAIIIPFAASASPNTTGSAVSHMADSQTLYQSHALAIYGEPKYPANFKRFDYTSPKATTGGKIRLKGIYESFDSLNQYIAKGNADDSISIIYDTLTTQAMDEPFTQYGLVAHTIEYPEDRSWVVFYIRPEARFHDNTPMTAEDVAYSFNLLMEKGNPAYKFFYGEVEKVEAIEKYKVKFTFKIKNNRELALSVGQLPILPKHFWLDKDFANSSLEVPLGSGPYRIENVNPGRNITYSRVENYWGKDLAVNQGLYNFDSISVDFYRDNNIAVEALKAGEYDYRWENSSKFWATAYDIPAVKRKELIKKVIRHEANTGVQAFVFNLRKTIFDDIELRKAISYAFDFEWTNKTLFYNAYQRSYSFFTNSEFAARGVPDTDELELLNPHKSQLPPSVFTEEYNPPQTDGNGRIRPNLRKAKKLLDDNGYVVKKNQLYNKEGQAIRFEILLRSPTFERIINPFAKNLSRLGITATVRNVDASQFVNRRRSFDFDVLVHVYPQSESLGSEQRNFWGSEAASSQGSDNYIGIKNPVIDSLIENVVNAKNRKELVVAGRALDRVLLHNHYIIPQWYKASSNIVYWDKFGIPDISPKYDNQHRVGIFTWWYDEEKANKLKNKTE